MRLTLTLKSSITNWWPKNHFYNTTNRLLQPQLAKALRLSLLPCRAQSNVPEAKSEKCATLAYVRDKIHLTVPLPSRAELCLFILPTLTPTMGEVLQMIRQEDSGIEDAIAWDKQGIRISASCPLQYYLDDVIYFRFNNCTYRVKPPTRERLGSNTEAALKAIEAQIRNLYGDLDLAKKVKREEVRVRAKLQQLEQQMEPLKAHVQSLQRNASSWSNACSYAFLFALSAEMGFLFQLCYGKYSWDVVEPMTYFLNVFHVMCFTGYFLKAKQHFELADSANRIYLKKFHKYAAREGFDTDLYNELQRKISKTKYELQRLKDPIAMYMSAHLQNPARHQLALSQKSNFVK